MYRRVQQAIVRMQSARSVNELAQICAEQVRRVSGFDRAMVYRFDSEWNGSVIAEERGSDLEPFLGLHYPASDIPRQARELYTAIWLRFIADRDYQPAGIVSKSPPGAAPLDLSYAVLRSVSPIHLECLRNMGVRASMSISLLRDGRLWGLVACHHYSGPRFVPYDLRTACELLGQFMSLQIASVERAEHAEERRVATEMRRAALANVARFEDVPRALLEAQPGMLELIPSDGAAIVNGQQVSRTGHTPAEPEIVHIAEWLDRQPPGDVFATDRLAQQVSCGLLASVAAGLLAVRLPGARQLKLLWFRTEKIRTVDWAGDPAKSVIKGDGVARLSPRGSFALWKETVRGRSAPWTALELEAAGLLHEGITRLMLRRGAELAAAHHDLRLASEEREKTLDSERAARAEAERLNRLKDDFVATLSHELRTPLNAILGWAQLLARRADLPPDLAEGLAVIERNARSQNHMIGDLLDVSRIIAGKLRLDLQRTDLPGVIEAAIDTLALAAAAKEIRVEKLIDPLSGLQITGDPGRLQQVVWNLLANAVKFTPKGGRIQVVLERVQSHVELSVADTGQGIRPEMLPHVFERFQQGDAAARRHGGLGLGLSIVRNLVELHGGTVRGESPGPGRGSRFVVCLPVRVIQQAGFTAADKDPLLPDCERLNLSGVRVLVIDDEPDARELIRRMLAECECHTATTASATEAIGLLRNETFDAVISDLGMPHQDGYAFIRALRRLEAELGRRRVPAIALTAYVRAEDRRRSILAGFQAHLSKPVESGELLAQVASLTGRV